MPKPVMLDYQPVPRSRRGISIFWLGMLGLLVLALAFWLLPTTGAPAREGFNRKHCADNLHQIGLAIAMYCNQNQQQYPSELAPLILTQGLNANVFACPSDSVVALEAPTAQQAATLLSGDHCSYIYVGAGMTSAVAADRVVAFDVPDTHSRDGGNVLYADAHVQWQPFETLVQLVPELEAGRNPPAIGALTAKQAKAMYEQKWVPKLPSMKNGTWAASLPRPATRPSANGTDLRNP